MLKSVETIFKRTISHKKTRVFLLSTAAQTKNEERLSSFRTTENDPVKHTTDHLSQFYKVDEKDKKSLFLYGGLPKSFQLQAKTFNETCLMIRQPAIDIINCIKSIDFSKPAVRFVLYGEMGSGKSLSLAHVIHYCFRNNFLIVHVPWLGNWMRRCQEYSNSETKEGFVDLNIDAAAWLLHFKTQNTHLLSNPDIKTSEDHVWSKREVTPAGSPLSELVEHGINRVKYASTCAVILCDEIKKLSTQGVCKTLVTVDGYNAFFYPNTRVYTEKKEVVHPHKVTLTEGFLNLSKFDWNNGVVVLTVDEIAIAEKDQISHLPKYLLGKDGFAHLDPFVPISVPNYSKKELLSCLDYYRERKWVRPFEGQDEELSFVSGNNPYKLMNICAPL
ncbi:28S ribosomal protein S29, mitochondrial [Anoplophora glabripennis]|uniref:28S ribosomal protein S29, mitochondrial n=1 Tax=Anoplophora glabripennis TaxID=217634 RepID=UPI0008744F94|nr:28S ribosomal protein S29, mitochondrial [Anoplophora glabripennis]XP_018567677.1 28S ribosomal protein S29, mitochondrial [Anoplophora glabripennis]